MKMIPQAFQDLLQDETRAIAYLATTMKDGTPQVTPVWFNTQEGFIWVNSAQGRVKDRNMRARPQVALVIADPTNAYRYLQIRGKVVEITDQGAREHINALAKKYTGQDRYSGPAHETRVIYKISPEHVNTMG